MKLVAITGNHGGNIDKCSWDPAVRTHACLAGAVAVVGAALIAANPLAPSIATGVVHRDVQLASVDTIADLAAATDPVTEWSSVINEAATNLQTIGAEFQADPFPALAQVLANQIEFGETIGTNLQSLASGLSTVLTDELPGQLQTLFAGIDAGEIGSSVNTFTGALLVDLLPGVSSLVNIFAIPGEIAQNLANVLTDNLTSVGLETLLGPTGVLLGTTQAFADSSQAILDALEAGQSAQAFTDLLDMPAIVTGAFLNGYDAFDTYGIAYGGLLSTIESASGPGILDELLVQIPQAIAQTLADGGTPATLAADWSALLAEFAPNIATDALAGL